MDIFPKSCDIVAIGRVHSLKQKWLKKNFYKNDMVITCLQVLAKLKACLWRWNSFQMEGGSSSLDNLGLYTEHSGFAW